MFSPYRAAAFLVCFALFAAEPSKPPAKEITSSPWNGEKRLPGRPYVRLGTRRLQQERGVDCVAFSPDSRIVAANYILWDVNSGKKTRAVHLSDKLSFGVTKLAFSPDGKVLAGLYLHFIRLWETATGKILRELSYSEGCLCTLAFAPQGKYLAASTWSNDDKKPSPILLWETATGRLMRRLPGSEKPARQLAFSAKGKRLLSLHFREPSSVNVPQPIGSGFLLWWDVESGKQIRIWSQSRFATLSCDGKTLATAGNDSTLRLWDAATFKEKAVLNGHRDRVMGAAFTPDGKTLVSVGWDQTAKVWDADTGAERSSFPVQRQVWSMALSPDGKMLATASGEGTIKLWEVTSGKERLTLRHHPSPVRGVAFSPDGKLLAAGNYKGVVKIWSTADGKEIASLEGHEGMIFSLRFSPDGKMLASAGRDGTARLWQMAAVESSSNRRASR